MADFAPRTVSWSAAVTRWVRLLEGYAGPPWRADRVELVQSFLGQGPRGRPRYETVDTFPLGADRPL
ncbi:hypothetical protein [Nocardioides sp.]|uniref:hypothetical protein n=1 Tax=Nocardioides sp. TaxID=35761 RepID=UPI0025D0AA01|nr:hypothetical protein [Nocardioides sp.]